MFSLYFDEDASNQSLIRELRRIGYECLTTAEAGWLTNSDEDQLSFAASQHRILYTMNIGDFSRLHNEWVRAERSHSGIIIVTQQHTSVGVQLRATQQMSAIFEHEDMANRLEFLLNYA